MLSGFLATEGPRPAIFEQWASGVFDDSCKSHPWVHVTEFDTHTIMTVKIIIHR